MTFPAFEKTVIVVEPSHSIRSMVSASLKENDFREIVGVATLIDALKIMETDSVAWIILPLAFTAESNTLGLLTLCRSIADLRDVKVSVVIPAASWNRAEFPFELGLFSYFPEHTTQEQFSRDLGELLKVCAECEKDSLRVTAHYLRKLLVTKKYWTDLIRVERRLCSLYTGDGSQLLNLAKAHFHNEDFAAGELALAQAETINPNLEKAVRNLSNLHLQGKRQLGRGPGERFNILGISDVLVVDGDETTQNALFETFTELGVPNVTLCYDGETAIAEAKRLKSSLGLIIQEWRVAKLPGYALIQRMRDLGLHAVPIVVLSSLLQKDDRELIVEFGANDLCEKPFSKSPFVKMVVNAVLQERKPTDPILIEMKVRKFLANNLPGEAMSLFTRAKAQKRLPRALEFLCAAQILYAKENFAHACRQATEAVRLGAPQVLAQNVLGKCMMKLGHYEAAIQCFEKAQALSPKNVERLCALAEAYRLTGDQAKSEDALSQANNLDQGSDTSQAAQLAAGYASEDPAKILNVAKNLRSVDDIVSLTNNRAVAFVRIGRIEEAVELYNSILDMLPSPSRVKLVPVNYNIGLALVRIGDLQKAQNFLDKALEHATPEQEQVKKKAQSLASKIKFSLDTGAEIYITPVDSAGPIGVPAKPSVEGKLLPPTGRELEASAPSDTAPSDMDPSQDLATPVIKNPSQSDNQLFVAEDWPDDLKQLAETPPKYKPRS